MSGIDCLSDVFIQVLEQTIDGVIVVGCENQIKFINKAAESLWGYSKKEAFGQSMGLLVPHDITSQHDNYINKNSCSRPNNSVETSQDVPIRHKDGSDMWGAMSISKVEINNQILYIVFIRDVTLQHNYNERIRLLSVATGEIIASLSALTLEREQNQNHIQQLAYYDSLTSLPNRSCLHINAKQLLIEASQKKQPVAILFIGLDRFKQVNNSMGNAAGDELLQLIASRLQKSCRRSDLVGRLSADEFMIILPQCGVEYASEIACKLQQIISTPCQIRGKTLAPSAGIGISLFPQDGNNISTLSQFAAIAMSQAKNYGIGKTSIFNNRLSDAAKNKQELETAFRHALSQCELELYYQPQIRLDNGLLYGVEALARWQHAKLGNIPPIQFIPLAEESGLIEELGIWVINEACHQLSVWRKHGLLVPKVSINLSPTSFSNTNLPQIIANTLARHQLTPKDLILEITEDVLIDDNHITIINTATEIHNLGVKLAIDDFGKGYSSLSYLRLIPISELKLDRNFVTDLEHNHAARAISKAVFGIGRGLQLTVIAEGIENNAQKELLQLQGYQVGQGYLFCCPLPVHDFESWLHVQSNK